MAILTLFVGLPAVRAESEKKEQRVNGKIVFEDGAKGTGDLYLTAVPSGEELIQVEKSAADKDQKDRPKEVRPPQKNGPQIISLGRNASKPTSFSVDLPPGNYKLGCLLKISGPPCTEVTVNDKKMTLSCMPGEADVVCSGISLTVEDQPVDNVILRAGVGDRR